MSASLTAEAVRQRAAGLPWYHQIDLGNGFVTPGPDRSQPKLELLKLPSLTDKSVLDVGAWDGFFSFAAERMGASRVVALESFSWGDAPWGSKACFELAREVFDSNVEDVHAEVLDVSEELVGRFDVVFFLGVLYHMRHPFLALERVASVCDEMLVLETLADLPWVRRPAAAFYPGSTMNNDPTNWWGPNAAAVRAMLHELGFSRVEVVSKPSAAERAKQVARQSAEVVVSRLRRNAWTQPLWYPNTSRLYLHAYR